MVLVEPRFLIRRSRGKWIANTPRTEGMQTDLCPGLWYLPSSSQTYSSAKLFMLKLIQTTPGQSLWVRAVYLPELSRALTCNQEIICLSCCPGGLQDYQPVPSFVVHTIISINNTSNVISRPSMIDHVTLCRQANVTIAKSGT